MNTSFKQLRYTALFTLMRKKLKDRFKAAKSGGNTVNFNTSDQISFISIFV